MTVNYPDEFALTIISREAYVGIPDHMLLTIPIITHPNQTFTLTTFEYTDRDKMPDIMQESVYLGKFNYYYASISCVSGPRPGQVLYGCN